MVSVRCAGLLAVAQHGGAPSRRECALRAFSVSVSCCLAQEWILASAPHDRADTLMCVCVARAHVLKSD